MKKFNELKELISKVISGDSQARNEFRKFCISIIRKYVFSGLPKEDTANEIIFKLFNNDFKALSDTLLENESRFQSYLKVITENYCKDIYRKEKKYSKNLSLSSSKSTKEKINRHAMSQQEGLKTPF